MFPILVYLTVLLVATCGLVYEFVAGTLSSYLLGGGLTQFSIVIGVFLSALGLGSYLSRFVQREVARRFIEIELAVALIGGLAAPLLFAAFASPRGFLPSLYAVVVLQGVLVGLEIPLIVRMLRRRVQFKDLIARALAFDYLGSLLAGVLFTLVLLPSLGLTRTGLVFGIVNALVAFASTWIFASSLAHHARLRLKSLAVLAVLGGAMLVSQQMTSVTESWLYADPVVYARQSQFQRIVLTAGRGGQNLFLDGALQFAAHDEYRYHEALVHPVLGQSPSPERVLVLGGGDGLAAREVLRHPQVRHITLVDIDPAITDLAREHSVLVALNHNALNDPRVTVVNDDAMVWLAEGDEAFDAIVIDFPDPNNYTLGKLYTTGFYRRVLRRLAPRGALVVQSTSPLVAPQSFWCIVATLEAVGLRTLPYHAQVPSFGVWGYVLASRSAPTLPDRLPAGLRYLDGKVLATLFVFPPDMQRVPVEVNRLSSQVLVRYYEAEWRRLF